MVETDVLEFIELALTKKTHRIRANQDVEHCPNMFEMKEKRSKSVQSRTMCHQLAVTMHFLEIVLDNKAILGRGRG